MAIDILLNPVLTFDKQGINCDFYMNSSEVPFATSSETWENIVKNEVESCTSNGPIIVSQEFDGVEHLNGLIDTLRYVADELEEKVREKNVILANNLIEGLDIADAEVSFTNYMKGDYE